MYGKVCHHKIQNNMVRGKVTKLLWRKKNEFYSNFEDSEFLQRFQVPQMMVLAFTPPRKSSLDAVKFDSCSKHCSFIREEMSKWKQAGRGLVDWRYSFWLHKPPSLTDEWILYLRILLGENSEKRRRRWEIQEADSIENKEKNPQVNSDDWGLAGERDSNRFWWGLHRHVEKMPGIPVFQIHWHSGEKFGASSAIWKRNNQIKALRNHELWRRGGGGGRRTKFYKKKSYKYCMTDEEIWPKLWQKIDLTKFVIH